MVICRIHSKIFRESVGAPNEKNAYNLPVLCNWHFYLRLLQEEEEEEEEEVEEEEEDEEEEEEE